MRTLGGASRNKSVDAAGLLGAGLIGNLCAALPSVGVVPSAR